MASTSTAKPTATNGSIPTLAEANAALASGDQSRGESILQSILSTPPKPDDEDALKQQEQALLRLGQLYRDTRNPTQLAATVRSSRTFMASIAKAKTAKLIRSLLDFFADIPDSAKIQIDTIKENIEWARSSRRIFLSQNLETRLIALYYETRQFREALPLIDSLLRELKKLDDKAMLTEVHLLESRVNHAIRNAEKAKASLTSARTSANSIYCPPALQAQLDMQSGILHAEDKDYATAYSYFFETLEGLSAQAQQAPLALKYMLLCKVMLNLSEDVTAIVQGKVAQKYAGIGRDVEAMQKVAEAHEKRSLEGFEKTLKEYKDELSADPIIRAHLSALYDTLLEQNLLRIIEPYSRVEIDHVASSVGQPVREVEVKLSQMILDKTLAGVLDQSNRSLIVFEDRGRDETYEASLEALRHISNVVDSLGQKAAKLS
ncbi:putative 26S proteasome non-atpase regulatory subunit Rpn6 [Jaminaea rosea]|uniref:Putative 26S proteasome non-atpase regulatory subunit Rpn6 n=1 Tax=Jaminaea rosea TaxID=1569628 RepID=A0A316US69_9BASI|nr:putative 26S proteasome non-atpase regulatory subunit Rpn6 [Jaminaea rosea]PWN26723.1 putative 26S proteasome non-atpase regulatory subunit Rpn6 [Jaminaea rosea]